MAYASKRGSRFSRRKNNERHSMNSPRRKEE